MSDLESYLNENLGKFKGGSLRMFGDWFGRPHDNLHWPKSFAISEGILTITFHEDETLTVWNARQIQIDENTFLIGEADHVRWEWFDYGNPKREENRFFVDYVRAPDGIQRSSDSNCYSQVCTTAESEPAVRME